MVAQTRTFIFGLLSTLLMPLSVSAQNLTVADVQQVIAQAVGEAQARGALATIAVADRVGNVLGVFQMTGAGATVTINAPGQQLQVQVPAGVSPGQVFSVSVPAAPAAGVVAAPAPHRAAAAPYGNAHNR